jgi:hypothetical protein
VDYLGIVLKELHFLAEQIWLRNAALLVVVSLIACRPGWISRRAFRHYCESPAVSRSPALRIVLELLTASFWPLWAILLLYLGFRIWMHLAPGIAGNPCQVLSILCFFLLYRLLAVLTKELLPPGARRKRIRRGLIKRWRGLSGVEQKYMVICRKIQQSPYWLHLFFLDN